MISSLHTAKNFVCGFLVTINLKFSFWFVGNVVTCECKYQVSISSQL